MSEQKPANICERIGYRYIAANHRYRCGVGTCVHHYGTANELVRHIETHSTHEIFRCPHCKVKLESNHNKTTHKDIIRHLELHGTDVFGCGLCENVFSTNHEVRLHLIHDHKTTDYRYIRKYLDSNGQPTRIDDITVRFECNICLHSVTTISMAIDHFKTTHYGANIDYTAIEFIKRIESKSKKLSTVRSRRAFSLQQHLICALCDATFAKNGLYDWKTKEGILLHHQMEHMAQPLAIQLSPLLCFNSIKASSTIELAKTNAKFDQHILYACAHCQVTYFGDVTAVHAHWKQTHENQDFLPFRFHAHPLVACKHCPTLSTFHDLIVHHDQQHPSQEFAAVNPMNPDQCMLCHFMGYNILEHFRHEHSILLQGNITNPVCFNETTLNQLLAINVHKKFKCGRCKTIFEMKDELCEHNFDEHQSNEIDLIEFLDNESVELIGGCCRTKVDQITFFEHLASHERNFVCPQCTFRSSDSFEFMNHGIDVHETHNDAYTLDIKYMHTQFWKSEYIFGNGLVVNKHNLIGTSIDDSQRFKEFAKALVAEREKNYCI